MIEGREVGSAKGAVAAGPEEAARVGARILARGGNAMDAAAATCMACCMLEPHATGVGGYVCAAVVLEGTSGRVWSLDANSIAPAAAQIITRYAVRRTRACGSSGVVVMGVVVGSSQADENGRPARRHRSVRRSNRP